MPTQAIMLIFGAVIWWLLRQDRANRGQCSSALWVPLAWFLISGSRSVSSWFGPPSLGGGISGGNIFDTLISLGLLLSGLIILSRRRVSWGAFFRKNPWLGLYFAYIGISSFWSDEPSASMKAWLKDAGNVVMVLVALSEEDPVEALKSFFFRSGAILILGSLMLVKYFPMLGRTFDDARGIYRFIGVSTNKNGLGATLLVCVLGTIWSLINLRQKQDKGKGYKAYVFAHLLIILIGLYLLNISHSATSFACTVLGAGIIALLSMPKIRNLVQRLGLSFFIIMPLVGIALNYVFDVTQIVVWATGKDLTFTGRTGIWELCFKVQVDPLIGSGYSSFLTGQRAIAVASGMGFPYVLSEVHNGYLETYFNVGAIGLVLLLGAIFFGVRNLWQAIYVPGSYFAIRFAAVIVGLIYNMSESAFSGPHQIWFMTLLALVEFPRPVSVAVMENEPAKVEDPLISPQTADGQGIS